MSENTVAQYDPDKLMDSVKARIRSEFAALIPEQAWTALVKKSVDSFFEKKRRQYSSEESPSDFESLVAKLFYEDASRRIKAVLEGPEWASRWTGSEQMVSEAVGKLVKENVAEIVNRLLGNAIQSVVTGMQGQLR